MHRAAGGFGGFNILARSVIPVPYPKPFEEFTVLVNDWWKKDHKVFFFPSKTHTFIILPRIYRLIVIWIMAAGIAKDS